MQQFCNTCGAPITAGMTACARCGTPVVSSGSGAYDPTVRAGTPPGSAYGSQPYGPTGNDPYGAPPPPPPPGFGAPQPGFGSPPQPGYGSAATQQGFGGPPPGFGSAPQPGYAGPPPYMAPPPQPKKSRAWIYIVGGILVVLLLICGVGIFALRALGGAVTNAANSLQTTVATETTSTAFQQESTTGPHITKIQTGTGFDQNTGLVEGEQSTFTTSDDIWVVYTVTNPDPNAQVTLTLNPGGSTASSPDLDNVTNEYANEIQISDPGIYTIEIDYNGTPEATIDFQVTD